MGFFSGKFHYAMGLLREGVIYLGAKKKENGSGSYDLTF